MPLASHVVDQRVDGLGPDDFQRLAERYARIEFPRRFADLAPRGRNPAGQTIAGWPDAYALDAEGRIDAFEATRAKSWRDHLDEDISELRELGAARLAGFLFVACALAPDPEDVSKSSMRLSQPACPVGA